MNIWFMFCLGGLLGSVGSTITMCLLAMFKAEEREKERLSAYKEGYTKGYEDAQGR